VFGRFRLTLLGALVFSSVMTTDASPQPLCTPFLVKRYIRGQYAYSYYGNDVRCLCWRWGTCVSELREDVGAGPPVRHRPRS
jgi:hypothetical protein